MKTGRNGDKLWWVRIVHNIFYKERPKNRQVMVSKDITQHFLSAQADMWTYYGE